MVQYLTSFSDIFKNSFITESGVTTLTVPKAAAIIIASLILGAVICLVIGKAWDNYKKS